MNSPKEEQIPSVADSQSLKNEKEANNAANTKNDASSSDEGDLVIEDEPVYYNFDEEKPVNSDWL